MKTRQIKTIKGDIVINDNEIKKLLNLSIDELEYAPLKPTHSLDVYDVIKEFILEAKLALDENTNFQNWFFNSREDTIPEILANEISKNDYGLTVKATPITNTEKLQHVC